MRWVWHRAMFEFPKQTTERKPWIRWPDIALERVNEAPPPPHIFRDRVYFPYIPPGESGYADVDIFFNKRGRFVQNGFGLQTRFPFSFLVKTRILPLTREVIVYPSVEHTDEFFEVLPMITGEFETYMRGPRLRPLSHSRIRAGRFCPSRRLEIHRQVGLVEGSRIHPRGRT